MNEIKSIKIFEFGIFRKCLLTLSMANILKKDWLWYVIDDNNGDPIIYYHFFAISYTKPKGFSAIQLIFLIFNLAFIWESCG